MIVYRISKGKYKEDLSGTGAELYGGRWNNKGTKMLYTASSIALAMAEVTVHVDHSILPLDFYVIYIEIPDSPIHRIPLTDLTHFEWNLNPPSFQTQQIGDNFIAENKYIALEVPSAIVPGEFNILVNPNHLEKSKIKVIEVQKFPFDKRLFGL
ncbi:RES family NAD+ phosphorylase [uncultured Maribacter sp.]|uniref:RES family NAD+ phosphorylase n=1 Tax=uncultured Maribacter sp. TaxID=431308 RepID=UPI0030ED978E|tara:strand:+ start:17299 stop:17760 length:462 start_codon:yes stop_codon:yes gene_type:complete